MNVSKIKHNNIIFINNHKLSFGINPNAPKITHSTNTKSEDKNQSNKYILAAIGVIIALILLFKHKSIKSSLKSFFNVGDAPSDTPPQKIRLLRGHHSSNQPPPKPPHNTVDLEPEIVIKNNDNLPNILVKKSSYVGQPDIYKHLTQENVWTLYSENRFNNFLKDNPHLAEMLNLELLRKYQIEPSLEFILMSPEIKYFQKFISYMKTNYSIDLSIPPKIYRFIGESELNVIKASKKVENLRWGQSGIDVTTNPELNWGFSKYRITFKNDKMFSIHPLDKEKSKMIIHNGTNNEDYYWLKGSYSIDDIAKIEKRMQDGFEEIIF